MQVISEIIEYENYETIKKNWIWFSNLLSMVSQVKLNNKFLFIYTCI